jgi:predicted MPP superfamily phosphohydrolase
MPIVIAILLLAAGILGHMALMRSLINWGYRLKMHERAWNVLFVALFATMCVVPVVIVRRAIAGALVPEWRVYLGGCVVFLAGSLILAAARRGRPAALVSNHTTQMDLADLRAAPLPAGHPPGSWLAGVCGNEIYRLTIAERRLRMRQLPAELEGLRVLHLSDLHFNGTPNLAYFRRALELAADLKPDLIALTGDVLDKHRLADWLEPTIGRLEAPLGRYFILGNHDAYDHPDEIRSAVSALGWTDLGGRFVTIERRGRPIVLAGDETPWLGKRPEVSAAPEDALRILLAHAPYSFRWAIERRFDLVLAGHLHGGQIRLPAVGPIIGGRYAEGVFEKDGTIMHVTRGLGVQAPLRFNCPPEIAVLVLTRG